MKVIKAVKKVGEIAVAIGVGTIVANAVKATTPVHIGKVETVLIGAGTAVLGWIASEKAITYIEEQYNDLEGLINEVKETVRESLKGIRPEEEA